MGNARIADFGLSYVSPTARPLMAHEKCGIEMSGTKGYIAPEMYRIGAYYGPGVDYFALGCIFFELLTLGFCEVCDDLLIWVLDGL